MRVSGVSRDELRKVPYIDYIPSDGRTVFLQPFLDSRDNTFKMFVPQGEKLTWIFAEPVAACYYSDRILDESKDIYLEFIDIIGRHYSFDSVIKSSLKIVRDIENCAVIIEKYFLFLDQFRKTKDVSTNFLVVTDLEYFFGNVRSLYDLLHSVVKDLWKRATMKNLPKTFHDMVKWNAEDLRRKYALPEPLIKCYVESKDFFLKCKGIRDAIYHRGFDIQIVYCTEDGFAFQKDSSLFPNPLTSEFDIWPAAKIKENGLVSVLALISHVNKKILEFSDVFSEALIRSIQPLPPISKTCKIFLRGPFIHHLLKLDEYLNRQWIEASW